MDITRLMLENPSLVRDYTNVSRREFLRSRCKNYYLGVSDAWLIKVNLQNAAASDMLRVYLTLQNEPYFSAQAAKAAKEVEILMQARSTVISETAALVKSLQSK